MYIHSWGWSSCINFYNTWCFTSNPTHIKPSRCNYWSSHHNLYFIRVPFNDTFQALGHPEDIFTDTSIQFKPVFATFLQQLVFSFNIELSQTKVIRITQELGTADFLVHHIHTFTIHVTVLILSKAILYARTSRLIPDKLELGFKYPCDGPGRGGTCQISAWDHIFLAVFWMYNSLSVILFHSFWKMQ